MTYHTVLPGRTAFDLATAAHETECARLLTTTFCDIPMPAPALGWRDGRVAGRDIAGGREGVPIPWVNEVDDERFPRCAEEGHGLSSFICSPVFDFFFLLLVLMLVSIL